jgi:amidase
MEGIPIILPSAGPLANDIEALEILTRSVIDAGPAMYDATTLDIPWRALPKEGKSKLRLGALAEDPMYPLHPPVKRALSEAVQLLKAQGHEIIPIPASSAQIANALELAFAYFVLDGTSMSHIAASGEPIIPSIIQGMQAYTKTMPLAKFCTDVAQLEGIEKIAALNVKRTVLAEDWVRIWREYGLDGVVAPAAQHTAVPHDVYGLPPYTVFVNVLDVGVSEFFEGMYVLLTTGV